MVLSYSSNRKVLQSLKEKRESKAMDETILERAPNQVKENLGEMKVYLASAPGEPGCEYKGKSTQIFTSP